MKKIAIVVTNNMRRWGVTSVILNLLKNIDLQKFSIFFISSLEMDEWFCEELKAMGIQIVRLELSRMRQPLAYIRELAKCLNKYSIDVLHVHGNSSTMLFEMLAGKKAGVPVRIAHSHTSSCLSKAVHYALRPFLIHNMTLGIACSDLAQKFAFHNKKSIVLNNGIITENFQFDEQVQEDCRKEFQLDGKYVIGHVGTFLPVKNHLFLCKIAEELEHRGVANFCFIFLGDGNERQKVEAYIRENNLEENIRFLGSRADIGRFYQAMDLFVLPSLFEGFPMVLVEAQTSGLKCLISDKVTRTTNLLGTAQFLDIEGEGAVQLWADAVMESMHQPSVNRKAAKEVVEKAGYSSKASAKRLEGIYLGELPDK